MFTRIKQSFKIVLGDRVMLGLFAVIILLALAILAYIGFVLRPSDVQVVTHYTAFGPTNFYRTRWVYLLTFVAFILLFVVTHGVTALKLFTEKGRSFALGFLWLSIGMLLVAFAIIASILNVATL